MDNNKEKTYLSTNLKHLRTLNGKSLNEVASICEKTDVAIHYWENGTREPNAVDIAKLSNYYNIKVDDLLLKDLRFDNAELVELSSDNVKIPVLGFIKAGVPIEAQENIVEYIDIPKEWTKGNKKYYGLKISGDSMYPNYNENDTVIFLQTNDVQNGKDCAVMVNCTECTFKKVYINEQGIILQPYNNSYAPMIFTKEQVEELPVKIVGIAVERRSKID